MAQQQKWMQQQLQMTMMTMMMSGRNLSTFPPTIPQMHININVGEGNMRNPWRREERGEGVVDSIIDVWLLSVT
jgi:hypothetical protein